MVLILIVLFLSLTSAQNYEIKGAQVKYYGSHIFGDWIGVSNDLNGHSLSGDGRRPPCH